MPVHCQFSYGQKVKQPPSEKVTEGIFGGLPDVFVLRLGSGFFETVPGFGLVHWGALALLVHQAGAELGICVPLYCREDSIISP